MSDRNTHPNNPMLLVLHALRVKGYVELPALSITTGLPEGSVEQHLESARAEGLAQHKKGRVSGWALTAAGRAAHATMAADALGKAIEPRESLDDAYTAFLSLNTPMKELCTRWQLEGQPPRCIEELAELDSSIQPVLATLAKTVPRFGQYATRFSAALVRLQGGELEAFLRPLANSYHDVWMELHQDLLLTLGRTRSESDGH